MPAMLSGRPRTTTLTARSFWQASRPSSEPGSPESASLADLDDAGNAGGHQSS